jgi:hypothetical protein
MSLYLLLAIAFGALTGAAEVPAARPAFAGVVARAGETRAKRRQILSDRVSLTPVRALRPARRLAAFLIRSVDAPLTGAASPRAPSYSF